MGHSTSERRPCITHHYWFSDMLATKGTNGFHQEPKAKDSVNYLKSRALFHICFYTSRNRFLFSFLSLPAESGLQHRLSLATGLSGSLMCSDQHTEPKPAEVRLHHCASTYLSSNKREDIKCWKTSSVICVWNFSHIALLAFLALQRQSNSELWLKTIKLSWAQLIWGWV